MALTFEISGAQIDGARDYQEDAFLITNLGDMDGQPCSLIVVADGMGGHAAGNVASNMAVQAFNKHVSSNFPSEYIPEVLNGAVLKANHSIAETINETPALEGMGCTMVGLLLHGNNVWWASVGDSHLYVLRDRKLIKINADHSYGGFLDAMAAAGTPIEPEPGLSRNMLMSAVTGSDISEIDCPSSPYQIQAGDKILVCSDGMDTLSEGKIIQYCEWSDTPKECSDALLNAVEEVENPKQDNTTVVAIHVLDKDAAVSAAKPEDEDITDTSEKANSEDTLEKTTELIFEENAGPSESIVLEDSETAAPSEPEELEPEEPEAVSEPAPAQVAEQTAAPPPTTEARESKVNKSIIFGLAAGLIIAVVAAYLIFGGKEKPYVEPEESVIPEVSESEEITEPVEITPAPQEISEAPEIVEPAEVEKPVPEKPKEEPPAVTEITEEPVTTSPPKEVTVDKTVKKEFRDALKSGGLGPVMVWIPAGSFEIGTSGTTINVDERPEHKVNFTKFAISKYEITFSEYDKFARATGRKLPDNLYLDRDTHPVIFVSWDDAYNYARWLSEQTGHKYKLPSEAQWEYAASGGNNAAFWWGYEEEVAKAHCFTCGSQYDPRKPTQVGSFSPNQFGLYDTAGNVAEWAYDCWHDSYKDAPNDGSVWEGGDCTQRVARGGSFISPQQSIRTAKRDKFRSDSGYDHIGIRLIRE